MLAQLMYDRLVAACASASKVYPSRLPENPSLPALTFTQIGGGRAFTHQGDGGVHRTRWQVRAWADSYLTAKNLAKEVVSSLSAWVDESGTYVPRAATFVLDEHDLYDPDSTLRYIVVDIALVYSE